MFNIKIENLKEGMIIRNYKELCNILGIKESAGNARKAQLNELNTYCNYIKEGHKFIINEIYKQQTITLNQIAKNSKYIRIIGNKYIYIMSMVNKNNFIKFLKHEFLVKKPDSLYKYIKLRIEDFDNNYEQPLSYFVKECDVSLKVLIGYNKKLIDYGFLIEDGKINKSINMRADTIKVQKNNIDPKVILRLRNEFTKYIGNIYKETKCNICGNNKNLELHHLDKSFSVILGECINMLGLNYNVTTNEYNILSNMMLGLQIKQEYKTLCKDCHSKYHELYIKQNKYKINKYNNLYKIITENKLD